MLFRRLWSASSLPLFKIKTDLHLMGFNFDVLLSLLEQRLDTYRRKKGLADGQDHLPGWKRPENAPWKHSTASSPSDSIPLSPWLSQIEEPVPQLSFPSPPRAALTGQKLRRAPKAASSQGRAGVPAVSVQDLLLSTSQKVNLNLRVALCGHGPPF